MTMYCLQLNVTIIPLLSQTRLDYVLFATSCHSYRYSHRVHLTEFMNAVTLEAYKQHIRYNFHLQNNLHHITRIIFLHEQTTTAA